MRTHCKICFEETQAIYSCYGLVKSSSAYVTSDINCIAVDQTMLGYLMTIYKASTLVDETEQEGPILSSVKASSLAMQL
jgi:hypothetical protein